MFHRLAPQRAGHDDGFEVYVNDRHHVAYRENDRVALVEVEFASQVTLVYTKTLAGWAPPHEDDAIPLAKRDQILRRVDDGLRFLEADPKLVFD